MPKHEKKDSLPEEVQTRKQLAKDWLQVRTDSQTSLLALGFADQALSFISDTLKHKDASQERMDTTEDIILSLVDALKHSAALQARVVGISTLAARDSLLGTQPRELKQELRTMPVDCGPILPFYRQVKEQVVKASKGKLVLDEVRGREASRGKSHGNNQRKRGNQAFRSDKQGAKGKHFPKGHYDQPRKGNQNTKGGSYQQGYQGYQGYQQNYKPNPQSTQSGFPQPASRGRGKQRY